MRTKSHAARWQTCGLLVAILTCAPSHRIVLERVRLAPPGDRALAERIAAADAVVPGVMTKAERDIRYEAPCGIFTVLVHGCDDTKAYDARIRDTGGREWVLVFFRLGPGPHPTVGDSAVWIMHRAPVYPLLTCAQRRPLTSTGCLAELTLVLEADDDVLPLAQWPRVRGLLRTLHP